MTIVVRQSMGAAAAFESAMKGMDSAAGMASGRPQQAASPSDLPVSPASVPAASAIPAGLRAKIALKRFLRMPVRMLYRLARPVIRPLAYRARLFLMSGNAAQIEALRREVAAMQSTADGWQRQAMDRQEELPAVRRIDRQAADRLLVHEARLTREIQFAREVIAAEISTLRSVTWNVRLAPEVQAQLDRLEQYGYATTRRHAALNCGNGDVLVATESGYVLCDESDHVLIACLMDSGELERGTRLLIERLLGPGDVFIDVGANVGLHTMAAARAMRDVGTIVSFEPFERTAMHLSRAVAINGHQGVVRVVQAAASNSSGQRELYLGPTSGHHSLHKFEDDASPGRSVTIDVTTLDESLDDVGAVDLLKIDVEGAELEVLAGARAVIARSPSIQIIAELGMSHLARSGLTVDTWLSAFNDLGFTARVINPLTGRLTPLVLGEVIHVDSANLLFSRTHEPM